MEIEKLKSATAKQLNSFKDKTAKVLLKNMNQSCTKLLRIGFEAVKWYVIHNTSKM